MKNTELHISSLPVTQYEKLWIEEIVKEKEATRSKVFKKVFGQAAMLGYLIAFIDLVIIYLMA
jgi:hypothetical protein